MEPKPKGTDSHIQKLESTFRLRLVLLKHVTVCTLFLVCHLHHILQRIYLVALQHNYLPQLTGRKRFSQTDILMSPK